MQEFYRERYYQALEWYDKIDRVENMAVLKPKKKYLNWTPEVMISFINGESNDQIIREQAEKKVSYLMSRFY